MKPMHVILLFSADYASFSNMWNFYWNSCLGIKRANVMMDYIIYEPLPVFH